MLRRAVLLWSGRPPLVRWRPIDVSHFDVCVVGAGPAGVAAALRAVDFNKRVCLIEAARVGGCDLWNGALQSKVMWEMSNFFGKANGSGARRVYGTTITDFMEPDVGRLRESLVRSSEVRERQTIEALRAAGVSLMYGRAFFANPHEVEVRNRETKEYRSVTADYFIIATGSAPNEHPFVKTDGRRVVTSDELMMMPLPRSMVIVGAGVLGSEFAGIYARLGMTKVYLIDKEKRIMPMEDDDIVETIERSMEANGVEIHRDSVLYNMQSWGEADEGGEKEGEEGDSNTQRGGVRYTIMKRETRQLETYEVERALIAVGRRPNYRGLGLHNAGCRVREGVIMIDAFGKSVDQDHIYAIGDAASDAKLVTVGEAKGRLVVDHIFGVQQTFPLNQTFSRLIFLTIVVAAVGMNEKQCQKENIAYTMARYGFELCSRTVAADNTDGFVKILAANDSRRTLLGVRVVGLNASSIIELSSAAIKRRQSVYELSELLTAYPSVSQAFLECLRVILGSSTLKPGTFPALVCRSWTPPHYERGRAYIAPSSTTPVVNQQAPEHTTSRSAGNNEEEHEKKSSPHEKKMNDSSAPEPSEGKSGEEAVNVSADAKEVPKASSLSSSSSPYPSFSSSSTGPSPGSFFSLH